MSHQPDNQPLLVSYPRHTPTTWSNSSPLDPALNVAIRHIATKCLPSGWDQVERFEDAPTTLQAVTEYATRNGRLCIATEDSEGTIYDCADTNHHLRAWHDSVHYRHQLRFDVAGEAAATYIQCAQLYRVYGDNDRSRHWCSLLLADILGLVIHYQRTRRWPKNKRAGTINEAKNWKFIAAEIADTIAADPANHEQLALELAARTWGPGKA